MASRIFLYPYTSVTRVKQPKLFMDQKDMRRVREENNVEKFDYAKKKN